MSFISRIDPPLRAPSLVFTCPLHSPQRIIKLCRLCYQKPHFLLCERCLQTKDPVSHQEHQKHLVDIDKYIEECFDRWSQIQSEENEAKAMFASLEELIIEAEGHEGVVESFVAHELEAINADFETILGKLEDIRNNVLQTREKFIRTLTDELKELRKLREDLSAYANEGSPLFRKKSGGNMESSLNKLQTLSQNSEKQMEKDIVIETFSSLVGEFKHFETDFLLHYQKDYQEEKEELSRREASGQIMSLINDIRNKAKYPPKYKRFQNSNQEFENFLKTLDNVNQGVQDLSEKLLLTQQEVTYKLTGENLPFKASFSSNNNAILLKTENKSRLPKGFQIATSIKTDHRKGITCLCVYDNQSFITGGSDALIKIWDLFTFKCSKNLKCETVPYCMLTMTDANNVKLLVSGHAQGYVAVFDSEFDLRFVFKRQESVISALIAIEDQRTVFSASYDGTILILDVIEGKVQKSISEHQASVNCLAYAKSLNRWASGSDDGRILIWNIQKEASKLQIDNLKEKAPDFLEEQGMDSIESQSESDYSSKEEEKEDGKSKAEKPLLSLILAEPEEKKGVEDKTCQNQEETEKNTKKKDVHRPSEAETVLSETARFRDSQSVGILNNGEEVKHMVFSQNNPRILLSTCYNLIKVWDIETRSCLMRIGKHDKTINRLLIIEEKTIKKISTFETKRNRTGSLSTSNLLLGSNNLLELMSIDSLMVLSFGVDHMVRLWNGAKNCCVSEANDQIKEFSLKDSLESAILMYNEKDDKVYFLSVGDKDTNINIWKLIN